MLTRRSFFGTIAALFAAQKIVTLGRIEPDLSRHIAISFDWKAIEIAQRSREGSLRAIDGWTAEDIAARIAARRPIYDPRAPLT